MSFCQLNPVDEGLYYRVTMTEEDGYGDKPPSIPEELRPAIGFLKYLFGRFREDYDAIAIRLGQTVRNLQDGRIYVGTKRDPKGKLIERGQSLDDVLNYIAKGIKRNEGSVSYLERLFGITRQKDPKTRKPIDPSPEDVLGGYGSVPEALKLLRDQLNRQDLGIEGILGLYKDLKGGTEARLEELGEDAKSDREALLKALDTLVARLGDEQATEAVRVLRTYTEQRYRRPTSPVEAASVDTRHNVVENVGNLRIEERVENTSIDRSVDHKQGLQAVDPVTGTGDQKPGNAEPAHGIEDQPTGNPQPGTTEPKTAEKPTEGT